MRRRRRSLIGLSVFTVVALAMTWLVFGTLRREIAGPTYSYSAVFSDVSGMAPGDDVRVAGVRVGRVDKIELVGADEQTGAKVTFRVHRDQVLYTDTIASVTYQNVIGQRYLGLAPGPAGPGGTAAQLADGGQIPIEHTTPSFDISYLLNGFEPLFTQLDPNQVDNLTTALIEAFRGDSDSVLVLTTQASALAATLAGPDRVLGELIGNLDSLIGSLAEQNTNLRDIIVESRAVLADLAARRGQLVTSAGSINSAVQRLATIVSNITPELREITGRQPGFLDYGLHDGRERFAYLAANLPFLLKGLARVSQDGSYLNAYACDVDFALWRGLFHWFRAFVAAATPGEPGEVRHSGICR